MNEISKPSLGVSPVGGLASYIATSFPEFSTRAVAQSIGSVDRLEVGRLFTNLFLKIAEIHDDVTPAALRHYFDLVLSPFPEHENNRDLTEAELRARLDKKIKREEILRDEAAKLLTAYKGDHKTLARLTAWNGKTARLVDQIAGTIWVENILNRSRQEVKDQYAEWERLGRPEDFRFDFTRIPLFNERLFFLPKSLRSPQELFGKGEVIWVFKMLNAFLDVSQKAHYEVIASGHPTIETTKACSERECDIYDTARELLTSSETNFWHNFNRLLESLDAYAKVVNTPMTADGSAIAKSTVRQEAEHGVLFFEKTFYNLRGGRATFDRTLTRRFNGQYDDDHYLMFKVLFKMGTWLTGDVDGHPGKKGEHYLLEDVLLRGLIARLYSNTLEFLEERGARISDPNYAELKQRWANIQAVTKTLDDRLAAAELPDGDIILSQAEFDEINAALYASSALPGDPSHAGFDGLVAQMEKTLEQAFRESEGDVKQDVLWLLRNVHIFRAHTAHREQRQDSGMLAKVVDYLLTTPELGVVANLSGNRAAKLDAILNGPFPTARSRGDRFLGPITRTDLPEDDLRDVKKIRGLVYHTLKRMQQALGSGDGALNIVIAEAKGAADYLNALFIQEAVAKPDNAKRLKIVLLFEEYDTLNSIEETIFDLLKYKAVRQHLLNLAGGDASKIELEIQIAHSDNTKRAGTPASRASIQMAHRVRHELATPEKAGRIRALFAQDGIDMSKFQFGLRYNEGKSATHANRGGTRSHTAGIDMQETHYDAKDMWQGGDWIKLMLQTNLQRQIAMHFSHVFKHIGYLEGTHKTSDWNPLIENAVARAFNRAFPDFSNLYYNDDPNLRGHLATYPFTSIPISKATGSGSRPGSKAEEEPPVYDPNGKTIPLQMTQLRAISDVEFQSNAQAQAALHAARNLELYLYEEFKNDEPAMAALQDEFNDFFHHSVKIFDDENKCLTVEGADGLRRFSKIDREVTDFMAYAGVNDALESLARRMDKAERDHGVPISDEIRRLVDEYLTDARAGLKFVLKSFRALPPDVSAMDCPFNAYVHLRNALQEGPMSGVMSEADLKRRLVVFPQAVRDEITCGAWAENRRQPEQLTKDELIILRHCRIGTMIEDHGYAPDASDPVLRETAKQHQRRERGQAPMEFAAK